MMGDILTLEKGDITTLDLHSPKELLPSSIAIHTISVVAGALIL
jgi:ribosome biogenesis SPOUT family RNA methylase Rps3